MLFRSLFRSLSLAKGFDLTQATRRAKSYVTDALLAMLDLGQGSGPMNHAFALTGGYAEGPVGG